MAKIQLKHLISIGYLVNKRPEHEKVSVCDEGKETDLFFHVRIQGDIKMVEIGLLECLNAPSINRTCLLCATGKSCSEKNDLAKRERMSLIPKRLVSTHFTSAV